MTEQYNGDYKVIYFFDVDTPELMYDQKELNKNIIEYCNQKKYDIVWFNKTIEDVLIGKVIRSNKAKMVTNFFISNSIKNINENNLNISNFTQLVDKSSNILNILDHYLIRK